MCLYMHGCVIIVFDFLHSRPVGFGAAVLDLSRIVHELGDPILSFEGRGGG